MKKYLLGIAIIMSVIFISGCVSSDLNEDNNIDNNNYTEFYDSDFKIVKLSLNEDLITLSSNQTQYTINGTSDAEYVTINCPALNISNLKVNVTNGSFSYEIKNIPKFSLDIYEKYEAKDAGKKHSLTQKIADVEISAKSNDSKTHDNKETVTIKRVLTYNEIQEDFKGSIKNVSYDELVKVNPYNFYGVHTKYSGEVISVNPQGSNVYGGFNLAVDGNRNQIIYFFYNGDMKLKKGDNITVWGVLTGDKEYSEKDLSSGVIYSGSSFTYGGYSGYGYSYGGYGFYDMKGYNPQYSDFYTSLGDYKFQPDAYAWYIQKN